MFIYRLFIKYCVFPQNVVIFLISASSAAVLVFDLPLCTHTLTPRGNHERPEPRIYFKIFEKSPDLMNTLYMQMFEHIFLSISTRPLVEFLIRIYPKSYFFSRYQPPPSCAPVCK